MSYCGARHPPNMSYCDMSYCGTHNPQNLFICHIGYMTYYGALAIGTRDPPSMSCCDMPYCGRRHWQNLFLCEEVIIHTLSYPADPCCFCLSVPRPDWNFVSGATLRPNLDLVSGNTLGASIDPRPLAYDLLGILWCTTICPIVGLATHPICLIVICPIVGRTTHKICLYVILVI